MCFFLSTSSNIFLGTFLLDLSNFSVLHCPREDSSGWTLPNPPLASTGFRCSSRLPVLFGILNLKDELSPSAFTVYGKIGMGVSAFSIRSIWACKNLLPQLRSSTFKSILWKQWETVSSVSLWRLQSASAGLALWSCSAGLPASKFQVPDSFIPLVIVNSWVGTPLTPPFQRTPPCRKMLYMQWTLRFLNGLINLSP